METASIPHPSIQVLILKADRLYAESLREHTVQVLPAAQVFIVGTVAAARDYLARETVEVLITGLGDSSEGNTLDLIAICKKPPFRTRRVFVVADCREYRAIVALHALPVDGVFDSMAEEASAFPTALKAVVDGVRFWSPNLTQQIQQMAGKSAATLRLLTDFEQVVLSVIGDGCDDHEAARQLSLSPSTISTVRRGLHRKLRVQHRGELVRLAAQAGFVRFTPQGVERPGFALLAAAYRPRDPKKSAQGLAQLAHT